MPYDRATIAPNILARIAGGELVKDACAREGISRDTLHQWARDDSALSDAYARAREQQAHSFAEQALKIADGDDELTELRTKAIEDATEELMVTQPKHWRKIVNSLEANLVQRDRLRVDTLKWFTSKIAPKLYGERQRVEVTGEDGGPIAVTQVWTFGDKKIEFK